MEDYEEEEFDLDDSFWLNAIHDTLTPFYFLEAILEGVIEKNRLTIKALENRIKANRDVKICQYFLKHLKEFDEKAYKKLDSFLFSMVQQKEEGK